MSTLKQRVPMCTLDDDGTYKITLEWLKDLNASIAAATSSSFNPAVMQAQIAAIQVSLAAILIRLTKVEDRYEA